METLWSKITQETAEELLDLACHCTKIPNENLYLINVTTVRDIITTFMERELESYKFKEKK